MRINVFRVLISLVILVFFAPFASRSQDLPVLDSLYSNILGEERKINLVFPVNYNPQADTRYEVIYCLDDVPRYLRVQGAFLQNEGFIPKNTILVGITNVEKDGVNMRDRDFTPTATYPGSGGADRFRLFLRDELMPFMKSRYKVKDSGHTLFGGSLGGLFVFYAFLTEPDLFTSYIAIEPSLWWDDFYLNKVAVKKLDSLHNLHNTLFMGGRDGSPVQYMGMGEMNKILSAKAPAGVDWKFVNYANESHYSTNFKGFWDGLKFSYSGFYASDGGYITSRQIVIKPLNGIVLKDRPFKLYCYNLMADTYIHYTTDGAIPTLQSPKLGGEETMLSIDRDTKVMLQSFGKREAYNKTTNAGFKIGTALPAIVQPAGIASGGLHYRYYEGVWDSMPELRKLKPLQSGIAGKDFDLNKFSAQHAYVIVKEGYIAIDEPGYYIFEMGPGNDYSKVYVGDRQVLGMHFKTGEGESFMLPMEKGFYPIRILYFRPEKGGQLQDIYLKTVTKDDYIIPAGMLYHR